MGNFDSLLRPENFQRMIEGAYSTKREAERITDPAVLAANKRATASLYDRMGRTVEAEELRKQADELEHRQAA
jgi:hypothetical protein